MKEPKASAEINFFNEGIVFNLPNEEVYRKWVFRIAQKENVELSFINYIFCSDEFVLEINREHLDHDYYTDIITFPLQDDPIESDIFISIERIQENAVTHNVSFETELQRVMAHGILHLCGYGDKTEAEAAIMRSKEDESIALF